MILCGVPRSGKTTFWKRFAKLKDFQPSENSPSTAAFESHIISANEKKSTNVNTKNELEANEIEYDEETLLPHLEARMLFDLRLYDDTSDLKKEALTIYRHILMTNEPNLFSADSTQQSVTELPANDQVEISDEDILSDNITNTHNGDIMTTNQPSTDSIQADTISEQDELEATDVDASLSQGN